MWQPTLSYANLPSVSSVEYLHAVVLDDVALVGRVEDHELDEIGDVRRKCQGRSVYVYIHTYIHSYIHTLEQDEVYTY